MGKPLVGIWQRLIGINMITAIKNDTRRTCIDQSLNALTMTCGDNILCADCVDAVILLPGTTDAGDSGHVEYRVDFVAGLFNLGCVSQVAGQYVNGKLTQRLVPATAQNSYVVPSFQQLFHDVQS
jgi:hypothetical protein